MCFTISGSCGVLRERDDASWRATFHRVVVLRRGQQVAIASLGDLETGAEPRGVGRAQLVGVELLRLLGGRADTARHAAAVAEEDRH